MDDMYADAPEMGESKEKAMPEGDKDDTGDMTAVLPKSILAGKEFKPGEEVMLEIVSMHDDEVVVKYASEKGEKDEGGEEMGEGEMPAPADHQMASNSMYE